MKYETQPVSNPLSLKNARLTYQTLNFLCCIKYFTSYGCFLHGPTLKKEVVGPIIHVPAYVDARCDRLTKSVGAKLLILPDILRD